MTTFCISVVLLILGYAIYSRFIEKILNVNENHETPATSMNDGIDYIPMKPWRIFLIQFLNIAGIGPICGAIMGAKFGSAAYLWIVFGCIFGGAVHDYISGFISLRNRGESLPEAHGHYLGQKIRIIMRVFSIVLLILISIVLVNTPATLIQQNFFPTWSIYIWISVIFLYYVIATILPINKIIGKVYPIFGLLILITSVALLVAFIYYQPSIPEIWEGISNEHPDAEHNPIFPMMFISIACGAISGFHATQSPLMARCITNEKYTRPIFYGAMIAEGLVALIWAAAASHFFHSHADLCIGRDGNDMVGVIAYQWFPAWLAVLTILGVIGAAVTSGDTALRAARLTVADSFHINQKPILNRILVALPIFAISLLGLVFSIANKDGFQTIWRYFSWSNQLLATVSLWMLTVYLHHKNKPHIITLLPALFMTMVSSSFILVAETEGLGSYIPHWLGYTIAGAITIFIYGIFERWTRTPQCLTPRYFYMKHPNSNINNQATKRPKTTSNTIENK